MVNDSDQSSRRVPDGVHIIAHSEMVQRKMDELGIYWGVQYELARGETRGWWKWSDVSVEKLEELRGTNALSAGKVFGVMKGTSAFQEDFKVWYVPFPRFSYVLGSLDSITGRNLTGSRSRSLRRTIVNDHLVSMVIGRISLRQIASRTGMEGEWYSMLVWSRICAPERSRSNSKPWSIEKIQLVLQGSWVHDGFSTWGLQIASCSKMSMG